ncbi:hypothetical protein V6C27_04870 [Peptococcaceae bacterium 1198_IL3148]
MAKASLLAAIAASNALIGAVHAMAQLVANKSIRDAAKSSIETVQALATEVGIKDTFFQAGN